jgi:group I intron endonuclease
MTDRTCVIIENGVPCGKPVVGRNMCSKHYSRWDRHGDALHGENPLPWATPGVYSITCLENGWVYIGSTLSFRSRWKTHKSHLNTGRHKVPGLQADWDKYGADAFICDVISVVTDRDERYACEQKHIDTAWATGKCYNLSPSAKNNAGHRFTAEQRQHVSDAMAGKPKSPEHRANLWQDREVTPEFREQMAVNGRMLKDKPKSDETRAKMSQAQRGGGNAHAVLDDGKVLEIRRRLDAGEKGRVLAREYRISEPTVSNIKSGKTWTHLLPDNHPGRMLRDAEAAVPVADRPPRTSVVLPAPAPAADDQLSLFT